MPAFCEHKAGLHFLLEGWNVVNVLKTIHAAVTNVTAVVATKGFFFGKKFKKIPPPPSLDWPHPLPFGKSLHFLSFFKTSLFAYKYLEPAMPGFKLNSFYYRLCCKVEEILSNIWTFPFADTSCKTCETWMMKVAT